MKDMPDPEVALGAPLLDAGANSREEAHCLRLRPAQRPKPPDVSARSHYDFTQAVACKEGRERKQGERGSKVKEHASEAQVQKVVRKQYLREAKQNISNKSWVK